jgi:hypothetical protein
MSVELARLWRLILSMSVELEKNDPFDLLSRPILSMSVPVELERHR